MTFAHLIAFGTEYGIPLINLALDEYADYFEQPGSDVLCRYPPKRLPLRSRHLRHYVWKAGWLLTTRRPGAFRVNRKPERGSRFQPCRIDKPDFVKLCRDRTVWFMDGWPFVNHALVRKHRDAICAYLKPRQRFHSLPDSVTARLRNKSDTLVGIHVRLGDYRQYEGGKYFYPLERYREKMTEVEAALAPRRVGFVVSSNERLAAEEFASLNAEISRGNLIEDLLTLSSCDYIIGPPSTFSGWASYYGGVPLAHIRDPQRRLTLDDFHVKWSESGLRDEGWSDDRY